MAYLIKRASEHTQIDSVSDILLANYGSARQNLDDFGANFGQMDTDSNFALDHGEVKKMFEKLTGKRVPDSFIAEQLRLADIDDSGVVDFEEYVFLASGVLIRGLAKAYMLFRTISKGEGSRGLFVEDLRRLFENDASLCFSIEEFTKWANVQPRSRQISLGPFVAFSVVGLPAFTAEKASFYSLTLADVCALCPQAQSANLRSIVQTAPRDATFWDEIFRSFNFHADTHKLISWRGLAHMALRACASGNGDDVVKVMEDLIFDLEPALTFEDRWE